VDAKQQVVREFYARRAAGDWHGVRALLAADVGWHEPGDYDFSGSTRGADDVTSLMQRLSEVTDGTFLLEPTELVSTAEHVAARIEWSASRDGMPVSGYEIAVYRVADGRIADAWYYPDGFDAEAMAEVFALGD
jgi:ketosteroid isomerase-like protein